MHKYFRRGCPRDSVEAIIKWRSENIQAVVEDADKSELLLEQRKADLAKTLETARAQRIKNDVLEGTLVPKDDVTRDVHLAFNKLRNRLMPLGTECANLAPGPMKASIKRSIDEVLRVAFKELAEGDLFAKFGR